MEGDGGQQVAAVQSPVQSARLNELDSCAHLQDVLERLPSQKASAAGGGCRTSGNTTGSRWRWLKSGSRGMVVSA